MLTRVLYVESGDGENKDYFFYFFDRGNTGRRYAHKKMNFKKIKLVIIFFFKIIHQKKKTIIFLCFVCRLLVL